MFLTTALPFVHAELMILSGNQTNGLWSCLSIQIYINMADFSIENHLKYKLFKLIKLNLLSSNNEDCSYSINCLHCFC